MHVCLRRSDAVQTGGLAGVHHVEYTIGRGAVGGLLRDGGHGLGEEGRGQGRLRPLVRRRDSGHGRVLGNKNFPTVDLQLSFRETLTKTQTFGCNFKTVMSRRENAPVTRCGGNKDAHLDTLEGLDERDCKILEA